MLVTGLCLMLVIITWFMDRASINVQWLAYAGDYGFFVNAIPGVLCFLLLLGVFNRLLLPVAVTLALTLALYVANHLKLTYLNVPVAFSDVYLLENLHGSTLELLGNFTHPGWLVTGAALVLLLTVGSLWVEPAFFKRSLALRAALLVTVLVCLAGLVTGSRAAGAIYDGKRLRVVAWSPMITIVHSGVISSIAYSNAERKRALDVPVDKVAVDKFLGMNVDDTPTVTTATGPKPDIIIIQSESFFDPAILKIVDDSEPTLPNLHRALASGIGGTMLAPTFGGLTLRTEFEVLTGIPMASYPGIDFPYLQITRPTIPSLTRAIQRQGYATVAIHGNSGTFWNRSKAFDAIGFDQFITAAEFPDDAKRDGWFFSEAAMTDQIIDQLDDAQKPIFIFAIGIEGHGPYLNVPVADKAGRDAIPAPAGLSGKPLQSYRNYLYHIQHADQELGRLWQFLQARQRPYVLAFYGDHLPPLQRVYGETDFDNGKSGLEQFVPWFIVGSDVQPRQQHIDAWMLGGEVLRTAGLARTPYYLLTAKARRALDADPTGAQREAVLQGMYSLGRLRLQGQLSGYLKQAQAAKETRLAPKDQP